MWQLLVVNNLVFDIRFFLELYKLCNELQNHIDIYIYPLHISEQLRRNYACFMAIMLASWQLCLHHGNYACIMAIMLVSWHCHIGFEIYIIYEYILYIKLDSTRLSLTRFEGVNFRIMSNQKGVREVNLLKRHVEVFL